VNFYYNEGCKAVKDVRIGDALKYWYWAYALSIGTNAKLGTSLPPGFSKPK
jgi:hypothetical protein